MDRSRLVLIVATVGVTAVVVALGLAGFVYSGIYPIAADEPHKPFVQHILTKLQERSVRNRASDLDLPTIDDPEMLRAGARLYARKCVVCHGAPGVARDMIGIGLNPDPPRLVSDAQDWSDGELFWIIKHGLKMAGMPAFDGGHTDEELWAVTAIVRRLPALTPVQWAQLSAGADADPLPPDLQWLATEEDRRQEIRAGDPRRGRDMVATYGCGSCHVIPGVDNARGTVGAPLTDFGDRHYIAGSLLNTPENLTLWILAPESVEPGTAMPAVGVSAEDAWDIAAYLLSLGRKRQLGPPHPLPQDWLPEGAVRVVRDGK
jgi:mono/diheme cytochrome c family protein